MKIAIMQPTFCPWVGYFKMIESVDSFVLLDCVQFERRSWQSRNRIRLGESAHWLSLHLQKAPQSALITDICLNDEVAWKNSLLKTLRHAYGKSVNFTRIYGLLEFALFKFERLSELNIFLISEFAKIFGLKTPLVLASSLNLPHEAKREGLLLEICKALNATKYLSPEGSKVYLQTPAARALFEAAGVGVWYFELTHPIYKQQGKGFVEYLSAIDLLFNETRADEILSACAAVAGGGGDYNLPFCDLFFNKPNATEFSAKIRL